MSIEIENIKTLLDGAQRIADHQEEIKKLKGETFNVFSILKMERRENETHSAFLGELLNPKGSHLKGNLFLKLFLETVDHKDLDLESAQIVLEYSIGGRNDTLEEGGRIDIYIFDALGYTICIENKIDAIDQYAQIIRYVKHNQGKNKVYYLTRNGDEPSIESKGNDLKNGKEYVCISYRTDIITWLEKCLKESAEEPILRESIKQYIILIKKITDQMTDNKMEIEIEGVIKSNYKAAKLIQNNLAKAENRALLFFLKEVSRRIIIKLGEGWTFEIQENLSDKWKGIKVTYKEWQGVSIALAGNPELFKSSLFGILPSVKDWNKAEIEERLSKLLFLKSEYMSSNVWSYYQIYTLFDTDEKKQFLFDDMYKNESDKLKLDKVIDEVADRFIVLGQACKEPLSGIQPIKAK